MSATATFESLLEAAPDAMVGVDRGGVVRFVNRQTEVLFGYDRADLVGQPVEMLVPESFRGVHPGHRAGYFADPRTRAMGAGLELTGRRRDGSEFPVDISLSCIETEDGVLVTVAVRDITDRKKVEAKFASLLEAAPDAMVGVDQGGVIRFVNRQTEASFGYDRADLVGQPMEMLVPKSRRQAHRAHRAGYFAHPTAARALGSRLEVTGRRRDGTEFPADISLSFIETEDGLLVTAAVRDVSERNQTDQELHQMAAIIRDSEDAIIGKTLDGTITSWNRAAERMYGYSSEEIIGASIKIITPKDRQDELTAILAKVSHGQATEHYQTIRIRKDGSEFPVVLTISPISNVEGAIVGASTIAHDVSQQMQAFESARSMIESSLDALVAISPEGLITDANEATVKVTGIPRQELIGTAFSDCFTEPQKADRIYQLVFEQGTAVDYPLTMRHRDGTLTEVLYNASVYRDTSGRILGVFAAARDVTKQRQAQQEIAEQQAKALERLEELERFQRLTVGRELKMIELKKEIDYLRKFIQGGRGEPGGEH